MAMATIKFYLWYAAFGALVVAFAWLIFEFLMHGQWKFALLFIVCAPWCLSGVLMGLIVGWQEAEKWKTKTLMTVYSAFFVVCSILYVDYSYKYVTRPPEEPPKKGRRPGIQPPAAKPRSIPGVI